MRTATRRLLLSRRPAATAFDPLSLAPVLALRADVGTYQDAALTTPAVLDGAAVQGWHDRSGHGWDVTQATTANAPVLKLNYWNGKPALLFTAASSQYLINTAFNGINGAARATVFVVCNSDSFGTVFSPGAGLQIEVNAGVYNRVFATVGSFSDARDADASYRVKTLACRFDGTQTGNAARLAVWLSGRPDAVTFFDNPIAAALQATAGVNLGRQKTANQYQDGVILEVLVYAAALTDAQVAQVHDYIASQWFSGLPSALYGNGDSLTVSYPINTTGVTYPARLAQYLGAGWYTPARPDQGDGTGGTAQTAAQMATINSPLGANVDKDRQYYRPRDWHLLWGGINDLNASVAPATVFTNLQTNATARKNMGFKVAILTVTSRNDVGVAAGFEANRQTLNTSIRTAVSPPWDLVIGVGESHMGLDLANNVAPWSNNDNVHASQQGYDEIARIAAAAMTACINNAPANPVQAPAGGATLPHGVPFTIKWESYGLLCITAVNIDYSTDGGATWVNVVTGQTNNPWSYSWTPPNTPTAQGVVRVSDTNNAGTFGLSGTFTIT